MVTTTDTAVQPRFEYKLRSIKDFRVDMERNAKTGAETVKSIYVDDEPVRPTDRFWVSLYARYGFNKSVFKYFTHDEVFTRIHAKASDDTLRLCVERNQDQNGKPYSQLLAVSKPDRPVVAYDDLMAMLERYEGEGLSYSNGIVSSSHRPSVVNSSKIGGDIFENRFEMNSPIDGYGKPAIYLSLLRQVCSNGMIGLAKAFRSEVPIGKGSDDVSQSIIRMLDSFNNDEGYAALRQRLEAAQNSWASVYEAMSLYRILMKMHADGTIIKRKPDQNERFTTFVGENYMKHTARVAKGDNAGAHLSSPILQAFHRMTGDINATYGVANLDALSQKRQRALPVRCKVYDLLNFSSEVSSHYAKPGGGRQLQAQLGTMISGEFDMEDTADRFSEFADFQIDEAQMRAKLESGLTGSEKSPAELAKTNEV